MLEREKPQFVVVVGHRDDAELGVVQHGDIESMAIITPSRPADHCGTIRGLEHRRLLQSQC
jgi:hypothetical protein